LKNACGADHHDTGTSLNNLAFLYHSTSAYSKAEPLYLRAFAIYEKRDANHPILPAA